MNGIKMSDCRFYVNEEDRVVVCVIPNTRNMLLHFIEDNFDFTEIDVYMGLNHKGLESLEMPASFMGKAVCSQDDEWNEELGRLIAFARAKDKCYRSFFRRANTFINTLDRRLGDMITMFNDMGMLLEDKHEGINQKIDEMIQK